MIIHSKTILELYGSISFGNKWMEFKILGKIEIYSRTWIIHSISLFYLKHLFVKNLSRDSLNKLTIG